MARLDRELNHQYRMRILLAISDGWQALLRFLSFAAFCACVYFSARVLAGKQTSADLRFSAIANLTANRWFGLILPWGLFAISTTWGAGERFLRKRHIKRISSESSEMQKLLDPNRRSSSLSKMGDTNPEDS